MSTPATRTRQPRLSIEVRREQALDAALELIMENGYSAATMEAIARRMGIAKPVVYNAYGDRNSLLLALLEREERRAFATLMRAHPAQSELADPEDALLAWAHALATAIRDEPQFWRLVLLPPESTPGLARAHVEAGRKIALAQIEQLTRAYTDRLEGDIDSELAAIAVLAAAERFGTLLITGGETYTPERLVEFVSALLKFLTSSTVS